MFWVILLVSLGFNTLAVVSNSNKQGTFRFANHYETHMVLQREPLRSVVWGFGAEGEKVLLSISSNTTDDDETYNTVVKDGPLGTFVWRVELKPQKAGGPFEIVAKSTVDSKSVSVSITDVYFGDVWLCGGQSNMQFTLSMAFRAKEEEALADKYHEIRIFTVARVASNDVMYDFPNTSILQHWSIASKESIGGPVWQYFSSVCWMYGRKLYDEFKVPIGLISSNYGGTIIQTWSSPDALSKCGISNSTPQDNIFAPIPTANSVLWNAMIHPLLNTTIYGVIWYQAEANEYQPDLYKCMFPAMIADWRNKWHAASQQTNQQFPFGFVQLCNYVKNMSYVGTYPALRWAQTAGVGYVPNKFLPNTFMAVTIDLPDIESPYTPIHPRDKTDVAQRLYLGAMATVFGHKVQWTGPIVDRVFMFKVIPGLFGISVTYKKETVLNHGIEIRSKDGFEILLTPLSKDKQSLWKPVQIVNSGFDYVILLAYAEEGWTINSIRYEWRNYPCLFKQCAVYNSDAKLPSPPFNATVSFVQSTPNMDLKNMIRINN